MTSSSAAASQRRTAAPVFTSGSLMRHVVVMTVTGAIGLIAIFAVDALSLFWVSRLGDQALKAAIGYASQILFLLMSVNIGLAIAVTATVARALGAQEHEKARRLAASGLTITAAVSLVLSAGLYIFRDSIIFGLMHAEGRAGAAASEFVAIVIPANLLMALGMALSGILRAIGDARRAMFVTLSGGIVTAFADPLLIFGCGLGIDGAAIATVISRLVYLGFGVWGAIHVHDLIAKPSLKDTRDDFTAIMGIGLPAILANLATPIAAIYVTRVLSGFGVETVAGGAIVDRIAPLAFGTVFALTGSIGPIIGQNVGARLWPRVKRTLADSLTLALSYAALAWGLLAIFAPQIGWAFGASGDSAVFVVLYCRIGALAWLFLTCLFVANTAFNNLGFPVLAMLFNWGRATLGTMPFITLGALWGGVFGALVGTVIGAGLFGVSAVFVAFLVIDRLAREAAPAD